MYHCDGSVYLLIPELIEVALDGKQHGLFTVAVTSFNHSIGVESKHSSGKRLMDMVDVAIDTHVPYGDAALEVERLAMHFGTLSSIANVSIINGIMSGAVKILHSDGATPPVHISRILHRFASDGMIEITRTEFAFTDQEKLAQLAQKSTE